MLPARKRETNKISMSVACYNVPYNVPIVVDSLVGSIESDMGIKAT